MKIEQVKKKAQELSGEKWRIEDVIDFGNPMAACLAVRPNHPMFANRFVLKMQTSRLRNKLGMYFQGSGVRANRISSGGVLLTLEGGAL